MGSFFHKSLSDLRCLREELDYLSSFASRYSKLLKLHSLAISSSDHESHAAWKKLLDLVSRETTTSLTEVGSVSMLINQGRIESLAHEIEYLEKNMDFNETILASFSNDEDTLSESCHYSQYDEYNSNCNESCDQPIEAPSFLHHHLPADFSNREDRFLSLLNRGVITEEEYWDFIGVNQSRADH